MIFFCFYLQWKFEGHIFQKEKYPQEQVFVEHTSDIGGEGLQVCAIRIERYS